MRSAISTLAVESSKTLRGALAALARAAEAGRPLTPLAGGTDLLVELNAGTLRAERFLNVWPLARSRAVSGVRALDGGVWIGGLTTFTAIARHPRTARWPMLRAAALEVGGWQIQNRATICGDIAKDSPVGECLLL